MVATIEAATERCDRLALEIAWKAQLRLCRRYRRLGNMGRPANVVITAIAESAKKPEDMRVFLRKVSGISRIEHTTGAYPV